MKTVIIVEDNTEIAQLEALAIQQYASVEIISDHFGRVFDSATWMGVDVAVIDLMLPGIEGEQILYYLRDQHPAIRRVVCTAKPMYVLAELAEVADIVLQKPFKVDDFVAAVMGET